jgi:acyl-homoserine-lactone acylase
VLRLRRGDVDLALEGAPDTLRALRWAEEADGRLNADFGDGFMMVMDWAPDGALSTRVIHQWGASEHAESPHFNDQSEMFARLPMARARPRRPTEFVSRAKPASPNRVR